MTSQHLTLVLLAGLLGGLFACDDGGQDGGKDGGTCEEPLSLDPDFSITFEIPSGNPEYTGDCTLLSAGAAEGSVTLELECDGAPAQVTVPGDAAPPGLEVGETLSMEHVLPSEVDLTSATSVTLSDDQGLVLAAFKRVYDRFGAGPLEFDFHTDCAEVHDYSAADATVTSAAGFIRVTGDDDLDLAAGETGMVGAAGLDFEVYVNAATAHNCCHGDVIGAVAVRR
ncbi:hypothetical protein [Enhygromyxa salina]|uniref:Lipoprotein n=1 Tax=Enhygromyxa salina TaxID=215803 RepID=A0A2S9YX45_9BACT|nr:hypothetical protein [Enhygromyxa salina]PRQ09668.1 hypothetical protein ENSA7_05840 [Enhygromyxa salina]